MFSLMDRVPDGITPMLHDLEEHITHAGLADMHDAADTITTVSVHLCFCPFVILLQNFQNSSIQHYG